MSAEGKDARQCWRKETPAATGAIVNLNNQIGSKVAAATAVAAADKDSKSRKKRKVFDI